MVIPPGTIEQTPATAPVPETALVKVKPEADASFALMRQEIIELLTNAEALTVTSLETVGTATSQLSLLAKLKKAVEDRRKEYVDPLNTHVKAINTTFKQLMEPVEKADNIIRGKVTAWRTEQNRLIQEAADIAKQKADTAAREAKLAADQGKPAPVQEPEQHVVITPKPPAYVHTSTGTLGTMIVHKWELVDKSLVPEEYKMIDTATISRLVKAGIKSIPGIKIWDEDTLRVDARK